MQSPLIPQEESTSRKLARWALSGALVLFAAGVLSVALWRREGATGKPASLQEPSAPRSAYVNRALFRSTGPATAQEGHAPLATKIAGTVYGLDGAPVPEAIVFATTFQVAGNLPSTAGSTKSDAQGRFELRIPDGSYYVNASREGYGPALSLARTGDTVSLILPKSGVVEGHVYDERKAPMTSFTIDLIALAPDSVAAPAPLWSKRFQSADGSFRVPSLPGFPVIVRATAPDKAPAFSSPVKVEPTKTETVDLTLSTGCTIVGRVEDRKGEALPAVFVDAEARAGAGSMNETSMEAASQAKSDAEGRFRLEHAPTGQVLVRGYDGVNAVSTAVVEVSDCEKVEPVKLVLSEGGTITGVVRAPGGEPVVGARLTLSQRAVGFVSATSDAEGRYRFEQIPKGVLRIEIEREQRHTTAWVTVKDDETVEKDIALFGPGESEIHGRVTAGGRPLAGAQLMIGMNHGAELGMATYYPTTGDDGTYRLPAIPAGAYLVNVVSTSRSSAVHLEDGTSETVDLDVAEEPAKHFGNAPPRPAAAP